MANEDDTPPGDRPTMKARKEMRNFVRAFGRDTPGGGIPIAKRGHTVPRSSMEIADPLADVAGELAADENHDGTTTKIHELSREPVVLEPGVALPLSDGVFARVVGRLAWTILAGAGIVGLALLAAAWLYGRR